MVLTVFIAAACGFLSGLGVGGGSLLMVWLTAVITLEQHTAQGINLLYFLPTAACSLLFHSKHQFVDWKSVWWAILGGVLLAALGTWLSAQIEIHLLRKLFGGLLLVIGAVELFRKSSNDSATQ